MRAAQAPSCSVTIPTLVLGSDQRITDALVRHLAEMGIVDVDVATGYAEARRRNLERDYLAVIIAGMPQFSAERDAFCQDVLASGEDPPGMVILGDAPVFAQPPCGLVEPALLPPTFRPEDLRRAILDAVGYAGHSCKSAGLCRQSSCHLRAGLPDPSEPRH